MQTNSRPAPLFTAYRWGARCALAAVVGFSPLVHAQNSPAPAPETSATNSDGTELLSSDALDELLGPIALYPDALIALILPASTVPGDITLASRYLANGGDANDVDTQSWDPSVKSLTRYPDVVKWMDDNLEWTTSVGQAFVAQPADVMNSIQQLRGEATAAGNLEDTPQQKVVKEVVEERTYIRIVPAEPEVIYVPQYDPEIVYVERQPDFVGPIIGFGVGFAVGSWLNYDCDWGRRDVYYGDYRRDWNRGRDWNDRGNNNWVNNNTVNNVNNVNVVNINNETARPWRPSANSRRQLEQRRPAYNRRVQAANAEVRDARRQAGNDKKNGTVVRHKPVKSIPQPTRLAANSNRPQNAKPNNSGPNGNKNKDGNRKDGNNPNNGPSNAALKPKNPAPNAQGNGNGNKNKGQGQDKNGNGNGNGNNNGPKKNGAKSPGAPPSVQGQLNKPKNADSKPKNSGNSGSAAKRQSQDRPKNANNDAPRKQSAPKPQSVNRPAAQSQEVSRPKPKNNNANNDRPKVQNRPQSAAPQQKAKSNDSRPKQSQPRPQADRPKQQAQPKPQADRPNTNKPANNGGGGNGGGGQKKSDKKKGDKKDN